ncbi:MAG: SpoIIIAH-like family protein [Bacilli bacterium]|nr:SpoIIIAH-like family protein [Bacilli bacterium]
MINKQNLWFMTLFSLILVLGVYYVTVPNDTLEKMKTKIEEKKEEEPVVEESSLTALRVNKENIRKEKRESLENSLTSDNLTTEEKNNTYELLKNLNEIQGTEEKIEKKIKKDLGLDCYTKIDNTNASVVCVAKEHDKSLANHIMRMVQKYYEERINVTVKFQKS